MKKRLARPHLYLDNAGETKTFIVLSYKHLPGQKPLRYSTGQWISPKDWDRKKESPKDIFTHRELHDFLQRLVKEAINIRESGITEKDEFKRELDYRMGFAERPVVRERKTILGFVDYHLETLAAKRAPGYVRSLRSTRTYLAAFLKEQPHDWGDIGQMFWADFTAFLMRKELGWNYVAIKRKQLSGFFTAADKAELLDYTNRKRPEAMPEEETDFVLLTEGEMEKLVSLKIEGDVARYRDAFLLGCWTGLRVSDYKRIEPGATLDNDGIPCLKLKARKTNGYVFVPLEERAEKILKQYDWAFPRKLSGAKIIEKDINETIKDICRRAGFKEEIKVERTKSVKGKFQKVTEILPKHELITTHHGRRYFATYWYKKGIPVSQLMQITGHATEKMFLRYVRADKLENAKTVFRQMQEHRKGKLKIV